MSGFLLPVTSNFAFASELILPPEEAHSLSEDRDTPTQERQRSEASSSSVSLSIPQGSSSVCLPSFYGRYALRLPSNLKISVRPAISPSSSSLALIEPARLYRATNNRPTLHLEVLEREEQVQLLLFSFLTKKKEEDDGRAEDSSVSKLRNLSFRVQLRQRSSPRAEDASDEEENETAPKREENEEETQSVQTSPEEEEEKKGRRRGKKDSVLLGEFPCQFSKEISELTAVSLLKTRPHAASQEEEEKGQIVLVYQCPVWIPLSQHSSSTSSSSSSSSVVSPLFVRVIPAPSSSSSPQREFEEILFLPHLSADGTSASPSRPLHSSFLPSSPDFPLLFSDSSSPAGGQQSRNPSQPSQRSRGDADEGNNNNKKKKSLLADSRPILRIQAERQCVFRGQIEPPLENVRISFLKDTRQDDDEQVKRGARPHPQTSKRLQKKEREYYTKDVFSDKDGRFVSQVFRCRYSPLSRQESEERRREESSRDLLKNVRVEASLQGYSFVREAETSKEEVIRLRAIK